MTKKILILLISILLVINLCGCMDYKGLDDVSIVVGIAVDKSEEDPDMLHLSFEIIDTLSAVSESGKISSMIEADGISVFDAITNANRQLSQELYFGNTDLLIINHEIASDMGMGVVLESFLRGFPTRDTLQVVISREKNAKVLISPNEEHNNIFSYEIIKSLDSQTVTTDTVHSLKIYEIYDNLKIDTECITLPAYKINDEYEIPRPQVDGLAIFKKDKLAGFLEEEDKKYFSFVKEKLEGGNIVFFMDEQKKQHVTQSVLKTNPNIDIEYKDGNLDITININAETQICSLYPQTNMLTQNEIDKIEEKSGQQLEKNIKALINKMQETGRDIFGFETNLYKYNHKVWKEIKDDWDILFKSARISVKPEFKIMDAGLIISY